MLKNRVSNFKKIMAVVFIVCIITIGYYFYYTRSILLYDLINKEGIEKVLILTDTFQKDSNGLVNELALNNEKDIREIMSILSGYNYSRKFKYINPRAVYPTQESRIHVYIDYLNDDNKLVSQYMAIDSKDNIIIRDRNDVNIEYEVRGKNRGLFEKLRHWLNVNNHM